MKKIIIAALLGFLAIMPSTAQNYRSSNQYSYNSRSNYSHSMFGYDDVYFGFRIGPSFTTISTDEKDFDFSAKTGLNFGVAAGFSLSNSIPLFLELVRQEKAQVVQQETEKLIELEQAVKVLEKHKEKTKDTYLAEQKALELKNMSELGVQRYFQQSRETKEEQELLEQYQKDLEDEQNGY